PGISGCSIADTGAALAAASGQNRLAASHAAPRTMLERRLPLTPSLTSKDLAGARLPDIRLSDRLLRRLGRAVARRPYLAGSVVFHALLAVLLLNVAAFD